jgi:hypothetical protein
MLVTKIFTLAVLMVVLGFGLSAAQPTAGAKQVQKQTDRAVERVPVPGAAKNTKPGQPPGKTSPKLTKQQAKQAARQAKLDAKKAARQAEKQARLAEKTGRGAGSAAKAKQPKGKGAN